MKTSGSSATFSVSLLRIYYAATLLFVILDYFLNINVRLAFLDAWPQMRVFYYLLCFACLGLIIWRPAWSLWIGTIESMLSLSLLIVTMGVRVMTMSEQLLRTGTGLGKLQRFGPEKCRKSRKIANPLQNFAGHSDSNTVSLRSGLLRQTCF
jgi:hypothetical protein